MGTIKEFEVAAKPKSSPEADEGVEFKVGDQTLTAYEPDPGQFAVLMATTGRGTSESERVAGFINFFVNILDERGANHLTGRLLNRNDDFGIEDVENIMEWLSEEWSGNPTQGSSASAPSPSSTGEKSTGTILS